MWISREPTMSSYICSECGGIMTPMFEDVNDDAGLVETVFHCSICDNDIILTRNYTKSGDLYDASTRKYFFG